MIARWQWPPWATCARQVFISPYRPHVWMLDALRVRTGIPSALKDVSP